MILGTAAVTIASADAAFAQQIEVRGNRRIEASTIRSYFHLEPGERLDDIKLDQAYKALLATGLFEDVRITRERGRIVVTVVEAPVINRVAFEGNKRVKDEQLNLEVQSKPRGTLSRPLVQADVRRIIDIYRAAGRYDVHVVPKVIDLPNNRVDLVFEITEGSKTTVRDIEFVGNKHISDRRLRDVIKTRATGILTFLKTNDVYDADRIEADRELLRRFYLKSGFADVRVVSSVAEYDPQKRGFTVTFVIDEGEPYRFGKVDILSNVRDIDPAALRGRLLVSSGSVYNAESIEKTVEDLTVELSKRGYAFAQVHPRGDRHPETHTIDVQFVVEEGTRAYIERINIRGNTRTRDYVIRREFDIGEGDAYNRVLIDRAERRLKNLNYFKTVKITTEPGSSPDRIIVNVDVEEQSTGEFSISGGYSTAEGILGEVSVAERNLLGRGLFARVSGSWGSYSKSAEFSYVEPYLLGYRVSLGFDLYYKETEQNDYQSYNTRTAGTGLRLGLPLREDLAIQLRYALYRQEISLPATFNNCNNVNPDFVTTFPTLDQIIRGTFPGRTFLQSCYIDGEASLAIKQAVLNGPAWTSSVGYSVIYNTLDNVKRPTNGIYGELRQDFAGVGGDVNFIRTTADWRFYKEVYSDVVALFRVQGGHVMGWGDKDLRMLDHFFMGSNLVRGFASNGIGPRDLTLGTNQDALGGSLYWGATAELQFPILGLPKDVGLRMAVFADVGSLWDYQRPSNTIQVGNQIFFPQFGNQSILLSDNSMQIRSSVGVGLLWDSPFGPIRIDYGYALTKEPFDKLQSIRFSGGTRF